MSRYPLAALYEDLERGGYDPRGPEHDFRSRCPGHGGESHSLHVREGVDRRAVLYCFAHQCEAATIMAALGRGVRDLFPDEAPRRRDEAPDSDATEALLVRLSMAGIGYRRGRERGGYNPDFFVADRCPACGALDMWVQRLTPARVSLGCWSGCSQRVIRGALRMEAVAR